MNMYVLSFKKSSFPISYKQDLYIPIDRKEVIESVRLRPVFSPNELYWNNDIFIYYDNLMIMFPLTIVLWVTFVA